MNEQTRIVQLLSMYEKLELTLEQCRGALTISEALCIERIIEFRQSQMVLLADASRIDGEEAELKKTLAARMGSVAACYESRLHRKEL